MRVLLIAFDSVELSMRLASALAELVDRVCLMLPRQEVAPHLHWLSDRVDLQTFDKPRLREPLAQARAQRDIIRRIRAFEPDVIHLQKWHLWFNLTLPLLGRYPLVISVHDPVRHLGDRGAHKTPEAVLRFAYRRAHRFIVHNGPMLELTQARFEIPRHLIDVIPLIERGDARAAEAVDEDERQVLFFGRIWAYKGLDTLIQAEPLITREVPDVRIVIAGRGDDLAAYRARMVHPERFVIHNTFVPYAERERLFAQSSVVVLPYVEATQSGVIPVAYTHGKPVVATCVGGLVEQIDDGRTGFLVPPRDPEALAAATVRLLMDRELRQTLGRNGRRKLEDEWSAPVIAWKTVPAYQRAIDYHHLVNHRAGRERTDRIDRVRSAGPDHQRP